MPKISIITINYNNLLGLKRTVESVINQTWKDFEYIIIDGGSTDGSAEYILSQNDEIYYWVSEPDKGIYNAMNKGIQKASGEYLLFLNSGDHFLDNNILALNYKFLGLKDIVYFNLQVIGKNEVFVKKYPDELLFSYFVEDTLPHPSTFIKKILFEKVGLYDENLKIVSDWKFFMESICRHNCSYVRIDETLSTFYLDGISSNYQSRELISAEKKQVLEANFLPFLQDTIKLRDLNRIVSNLRKSKKIKMLIKFGLLKKF